MYIEVRNNKDLMLSFKIRSIEKKLKNLGPIGSEKFNWLEWESLTDDLAISTSKLSLYQEMINNVYKKLK